MNIKSRIPKQFYKLFNSKYLDYYQLILIALYEASSQSFSLLGLTEEECQDIINEKIATFTMDWSQEQIEDEGELLTRMNMASVMLHRLEEWGWLRRDYDEVLNQYVVSFPDYSQMFVDLFQRIFNEENSQERESMLAVYSYLFTYNSSKEKDNNILKSALLSSKSLLQMLSNMQEGIRGYFEELSQQKTFIGVQEVLISEINNNDSQKYAILTTTDSFYRYKEDVKELLDKNLIDNENRKEECQGRSKELEKDSPAQRRNDQLLANCEEAMKILHQINREFDGIERRYNQLIDQKRVFAKRAAARIRYILVEGNVEEDRTKALVKLINNTQHQDEILKELAEGFGMTGSFRIMKEKSFSRPRSTGKKAFEPQAIVRKKETQQRLDDFVVKPLYTRAEIQKFRKKNEVDGVFRASEKTVESVEDLEKLLFIWQEETEDSGNEIDIEIGEDIVTQEGLHYSRFSIGRK